MAAICSQCSREDQRVLCDACVSAAIRDAVEEVTGRLTSDGGVIDRTMAELERLRAAGVAVDRGLLDDLARYLGIRWGQ